MFGTLQRFCNFVSVDAGGWRAIVGSAGRWTLIAASASMAKVLVHYPDGRYGFDWPLFSIIVAAVTGANLLSNFLDILMRGGHLLKPPHGHVFRADRDHQTSAILKRIAFRMGDAPITSTEARQLVTDTLSCIVLHVRDARGSHDPKRIDVFASLLVEDGDDLVVVARDAHMHTAKHHRAIPARYVKSKMFGTEVLTTKRCTSIGDLRVERPWEPTKPYRSILVVPVLGTSEAGEAAPVVALVSLDSSRPYFFQSFRSGAVEETLEDALQPYLQVLVIILDGLISKDREHVLQTFGASVRVDRDEKEFVRRCNPA